MSNRNDHMIQEKNKSEIMKGILTVKSKTYLSPHYISIVLEGEDLKNFQAAEIGDNNKILVPPNGSKEVIFPEKGATANGLTDHSTAIMRTYTLRDLDLNKQEMTIEFVAHGDEGPASSWAISAEKGDPLGVLMKKKEKKIFQSADWYLLAGDHTALPVISVMIASMQEHANGEVFIEVQNSDDIIELKHPANVKLNWLYNPTPGTASQLPELIRKIEIPDHGTRFLFAATESQAIVEIQKVWRNHPTLKREEWKAYSYWKKGQSESQSSGERKTVSNQS